MVALASAFVRLRPEVNKAEFAKAGREAGLIAGAAMGNGIGEGLDKKFKGFGSTFGKLGEDAGVKAGAGMKQGFNKSTKDFGGSGAFAKTLALMAARFTVVAGAAGAALPSVLRLTAALAPAAGAVNVLPAALLSTKVAMLTFKVATAGVADAIKAGLTGNAKQAKKALEGLPPAAKSFVNSITPLKAEVNTLRQAVSQRFFLPLVNDIQPLAQRYFPLLTREMANLAGPLGGLGEQLAQTARKGIVFNAVRDLFVQTRLSVINLRGAVDPLGTALAAIVSATARILPGLVAGFVSLTQRVSAFLVEAAQSGRIRAGFDAAVVVLKQLGQIVLNVISIFRAFFVAASKQSTDLLGNLVKLTDQVAAFLFSDRGEAGLVATFRTLSVFSTALRQGLGVVLPQIATALAIVAPALAGLAGPAVDLVRAVAPLLPFAAGLTALLVRGLTPAIAALSKFLAENTGIVKAALIVFVAYTAAVQVLGFAAKVQAAGGLVAFAKSITVVSNVQKIAAITSTALGVAFKFMLGPIGLIITAVGLFVAAVIYLFKNNKTFHDFVISAWKNIQAAVSATVSWFVGTALPFVRKVFEGIGAAAVFLYQKVILPVWHGIQTAVGVAIAIVKVHIAAAIAVFNVVKTVVVALYTNVFAPIFRAIAKVIEIFWFAARIIFQAVINIIRNTLGPVFVTFQKIATFVFGVIVAEARRWWSGVLVLFSLFRTYILGPIASVFNFFRAKAVEIFNAVSTVVRNWYNNNIRPIFAAVRAAWDSLAAGFSAIYNGKIKPLFSAFVGFIQDKVVGGFRNAVEAIRKAWTNVQEAARKPVAFVVNHVINPFIGGLNAAAKIVGVKDRIAPIAGFERGGQIPGGPSYRDNMLASLAGTKAKIAVASGEYITNTRSTMANLPLLKTINNKRGKVDRSDIDPVLDGNDGRGRGDGIGGFFNGLVNSLKGAGNAILHPKETLMKIANSALGAVPGGGMIKDFIVGAARSTIGKAMDWLSGLGLGGGLGGSSVLGGWQGMRRLIAARFPGLGMISGFRGGARTLSGNQSYHALGRAVDYPPIRALAAWIKSTFGAKTKELITPWQELNLHNGQPHTYTGAIWNQHNFAGGNAHVHWAARHGGLIGPDSGMPVRLFDNGGAWPSGTLGANLSGRTEYVSTGRRGSGGGAVYHIHLEGAVIGSDDAMDQWLAKRIDKLKRGRRFP